MSDNPADLGLIARQQQQLMTEIRSMKDDLAVMMAMITRMDGTLSGLVNEMRATHAQQARFSNRLKTLEDAQEQS